MSTVIAGGRTFAVLDYFDDSGPVQEALRIARAREGHALCSCVQPPRKLVIREVRGNCYLALWPNDGHFHDRQCAFHRDEEADANVAGAIPGDAIRLNSDGHWDIALDSFHRTERTGRSALASHHPRVDGDEDTPKPRRARLSVEELLHWLWHIASLNRWGAGWKRDWWRVERELTSISATAVVAGQALSQLLYVPPAFRRDRESAIKASWDAFATRMLQLDEAGARSAVLLVGHVKDIEPSPYGYRLALRHFAHRLYVDAAVYAALAKQAPLALSLIKLQDKMRCAVMGIFEVAMSPKGYLLVRGGALMLAGERFVTANNLHELALVNALTAQGRRFERPGADADFCDFLLLDTARPTALEIVSLDSADYRAMKEKRAAAIKDRGCEVWRWETSISKECPCLPPPL